jgi:hypothetical protein
MIDINSYTGLPFDFRTRGCWHHVRNVRADAGLETPKFDAASPKEIQAAFDAGHMDAKGLTQVDSPQNLDAVLMARRQGNRLLWHAGVYFDGMVSHCDMAARQVMLEPFSDILQKHERVELWR